jgi:flagellar P-ring protein precursor FlgI
MQGQARTHQMSLTAAVLTALLVAGPASAGIRAQDVARLQGQRTNKLMGYGLVVGLNGTGDGDKYAATMRALAALHTRYHAPVLHGADLSGNGSVAIVAVEATVPEFGAREGEALDVVVSTIGRAKSLAGGQLLTTPLQYAMFDARDAATQQIFALAGGRLELPDIETPTRAVIRAGATLEADFFYTFIDGQYITLVLDDAHAGWPWAQMLARAINHAEGELAPRGADGEQRGRQVVFTEIAIALGPKNVRVRIPTPELARPAGFISRVLQTELFMLPEQQARVTINRTTRNVSFTGTVTISPTILQIPGFGTVSIGGAADGPDAAAAPATPQVDGVDFQQLMQTLAALQVTPDQMITAIEHLHRTGTLHAQLRYEE